MSSSPALPKPPKTAWPTIMLATINLAIYMETTVVGLRGDVPWWVATLFNTLWAYVAYTALHEAVHRNIDRERPWLNTFVGMCGALPLFHNVELHKLTHLGHHAHLNNPSKDTDHWVAGSNPLSVLSRCATLFIVHYVRGIALARASSSATRRLTRAAIQNFITLAPILLAGFFVSWPLAFAVQVLPGLLAATLLGLTFDWIPHHPHESGDARQGTRVLEAPGWLNVPFTYIYLWQNYHQAHHVRPTIPFYLYRQHHLAQRSTTAETSRAK